MLKKEVKHQEKEECQSKIGSDTEDDEQEEDESEDDSDEFPHLNVYEKLIMKNKKKQMKFLETLKINEAKQNLSDTFRKIVPARKRVKRVHENAKPNLRPKSERLANFTMDLSEKALKRNAVISWELKEVKKIQNWKFMDQTSFKRATRNTYRSFSIAIKPKVLDSWEEFKPVQYTKASFNDFKLNENYVWKTFSQGFISAVDIHPHPQNVIVCCGNSHGYISIWNALENSVPFRIKPHSKCISNIKFNPSDPSKLISSSQDGVLQCGDMEREVFKKVYVSDEGPLSYFEFLSESEFLVSYKSGKVSVVDSRTRGSSLVKQSIPYSSARTVSVHPQETSYFVTADFRGAICIWDLRKLGNLPIANNNQHNHPISSASFSPLHGKYVLGTSSRGSVAIYDSSVISQGIRLISHNSNTSNSRTDCQARWLPNTDEHFAMGSFEGPKRLEVFDHELKHVHSFMDEYLNLAYHFHVFHPNRPALAVVNKCKGCTHVFMS